MILCKNDLKAFLSADKKALGRSRKSPALFDLVWKFEISLRKNEYYNNCKKGWQYLPFRIFHKFRYNVLSI